MLSKKKQNAKSALPDELGTIANSCCSFVNEISYLFHVELSRTNSSFIKSNIKIDKLHSTITFKLR